MDRKKKAYSFIVFALLICSINGSEEALSEGEESVVHNLKEGKTDLKEEFIEVSIENNGKIRESFPPSWNYMQEFEKDVQAYFSQILLHITNQPDMVKSLNKNTLMEWQARLIDLLTHVNQTISIHYEEERRTQYRYAFGAFFIVIASIFVGFLIGMNQKFHKSLTTKHSMYASTIVPHSEEGNHGPVHRTMPNEAEDATFTIEANREYELVSSTFYDILEKSASIQPDLPCVGFKRKTKNAFRFQTYDIFWKRIQHFASGLASLNMAETKSPMNASQDHVVIFGSNCLEWMIAEYACYAQSLIVVPLSKRLSVPDIKKILFKVNPTAVVCEGQREVEILTSILEEVNLESIQSFISIHPFDGEEKSNLEKRNIKLHLFSDIEDIGESDPATLHAPSATTIATAVIPLDPSSGEIKLQYFTHAQLMTYHDHMFRLTYTSIRQLKNKDRHYACTPLDLGIFQRTWISVIWSQGGSVGLPSLISTKEETLEFPVEWMDDLSLLHPTVLIMLPFEYQQLQYSIKKNIGNNFIIQLAIRHKRENLKVFENSGHILWDRMLFEKCVEEMGLHKCWMIISPLGVHADNYISKTSSEMNLTAIVLSKCIVVFGYTDSWGGLVTKITSSEILKTLSSIDPSLWDQYDTKIVGGPVGTTEIRLNSYSQYNMSWRDQSHELMNYQKKVFEIPCRGRGRIAVRGITSEWHETDQYGMWLPTGHLCLLEPPISKSI